jgi:hypothetical protein
MADPDRKGGSGLSLRTLAIASAASLTAAMVSSRIFPPGTIYASAVTPVLVAAVSEMLNRPAERVAQLRSQRRTLVLESRRFEAARVGEEPPLAGTGDFAERAVDDELMMEGGNGHAPIRIHGRRRGLPRRILHPKVWLVTGLAAFAIAVAVLTLPELLFGGAVANSHSTTFFGGGGSSSTTKTQTQTTTTTTTSTQTTPTATQTVPTQTTPTATTPTPTTPTQTGTQTAPNGGSVAPTDTGTSTSPPPSGGTP